MNPISRRTLLASLAALAATAGLSSFWVSRMTSYKGPITDHFDGERFFDRDGAAPKGWLDVLRWRFTTKPAKWPDWAPSPFADTPPPRVEGARARLSFVGHASWLIQTGGLNILVDPVWSERVSPVSFAGPKRHNDPGIAFDKLPKIDIVLVSHGHYDHLDLATLSRLAAQHAPRVITPLGNDLTMASHDSAIRAEAYDWRDRVELGPGVAVTLVPTRHWTARGPFDRNRALWASFVLETPAGRIYVVCDSGYGDGRHFRNVREAHAPLRLAILPIGAYAPRWFMKDQHMNPADAVMALADCGARQALANHHGTFQLTDEAIDAPELELYAALDAAAVPRERFPVLKPGQVFEI
ncbi:Twin-arginine translocation pathway signal [Rhodopseudomonas palustris HaA2]|uniref:Twin-arginine translocation pathway signal n=1 Tax=Rhodopseudomonas palustris (strain HaA2) TaxID=316058 RepID=Q2J393_RHOP2|nr:MBL fold metallo-hydrolase [Rhodopseudomonas palustris]ABD05067.1 Twin-arginine translocation pathway signal [Rhodopseudomonas palustris HaA2]